MLFMQYQERFVKQRNELIEHYSNAFENINFNNRFDKDYEFQLRAGVKDFITDKKYFELNSQENSEIENNNLFADGSAKRIERNWKSKSIDEVVRMVKGNASIKEEVIV